MDFFDLVNISERYMELVNPISPDKLVKAGMIAGMKPGARVIDFGCGFGTALVLWAEKFGIAGVGMDVREYAVERAKKKVLEHKLNGRLEILHGKGQEYKFEKHSYQVAAAIGTSFIWIEFRGTIRAMKETLTPDGKVIIGEPYWKTDLTPPDYKSIENVYSEKELLRITREEGYDIEFVIPSSQEDWDNYETGNWVGLLKWIEENPAHPERQQVIDHLHKSQDEYFTYLRKYLGWALFVLNPIKY
jgi:SAM-dependent methyltransferase